MTAQRVKFKVFMEGIEIPAISVAVTYGIGQSAQAQIVLPPSDKILKIKPRTLVHVFFKIGGDTELSPYDYEHLFTGEVVSIGIQKQGAQRHNVIQCVDLYSYFNLVKRYFYDDILPNMTKKITMTLMGAKKQKGDILFGPAAALAALIKRNCRSYPNMKGLLSGIISLIESVTGFKDGQIKQRGINDFFSLAQARLKLYQQIGAPPNDTSATKLLDRREFYQWLRALLQRQGNMYSLDELIDTLLALMFYQRISNPVAIYMRQDLNTYFSRKPLEPHIKRLEQLARKLNSSSKKKLLQVVSQMEIEYENIEKILRPYPKEDLNHSPQHLVLVKEFFDALSILYTALIDLDNLLNKTTTKTSDIKVAKKTIKVAFKGVKHAFNRLPVELKYISGINMSEFFPTTVYLPDIFFAPPPMCNVLYPEFILSFSFSRNFLAEPTRYLVVTPRYILGASAGELEGLIGKIYTFAPDIPILYEETTSNSKGKNKSPKYASEVLKNYRYFLLPHELYTGPIPQMEWFSDIRQYDPILMWTGKSLGQEIHKEVEEKEKQIRGITDHIPYLQHVANMNYVKARLGQRTASVSTIFLPYVVAGVPMLIIDKHVYDKERPSHYSLWLGTVARVSHSITTSGAATEIELTYVRNLEEQEDIFKQAGKFYKHVVGAIGVPNELIDLLWDIQTYSAVSEVKPEEHPRPYKPSYPQKILNDHIQQLDKFLSTAHEKLIPYLRTLKDKLERINTFFSENEDCTTDPQYEAHVYVRTLLKTVIPRLISGHTVKEEHKSEIPFEDQVRVFMSPIYLNELIGKEVYQPLFGTRSIVDEVFFHKYRPGKTLEESLESFPEKPKDYTVSAAIDALVSFYEDWHDKLSPEAWFERVRRPVATLRDILGDGKDPKSGFHSVALGTVSTKELLDEISKYQPSDVEEILGYQYEYNSNIPALLKEHDPRPEYRRAVLELLADFLPHKVGQ